MRRSTSTRGATRRCSRARARRRCSRAATCARVVFDAPYFDLSRAPNCSGLVSWGAHDAGCAVASRPPTLAQEIEARFGPYPATPFIYGFVWPDPVLTRAMGEALVRAVDVRAAIGALARRRALPGLGSRAARGLASCTPRSRGSGTASTRAIRCTRCRRRRPRATAWSASTRRSTGSSARWCDAAPDAHVVVFSMHGMGPNRSDVAVDAAPAGAPVSRADSGAPATRRGRSGRRRRTVSRCSARARAGRARWSRAARRGGRRSLRGRRARRVAALDRRRPRALAGESLRWMPAARYRRCWSEMDAFALPSFYDGRVRINLRRARAARPRVAPRDYDARCDEIVRAASARAATRAPASRSWSAVERLRGDPLAARRDAGRSRLHLARRAARLRASAARRHRSRALPASRRAHGRPRRRLVRRAGARARRLRRAQRLRRRADPARPVRGGRRRHQRRESGARGCRAAARQAATVR